MEVKINREIRTYKFADINYASASREDKEDGLNEPLHAPWLQMRGNGCDLIKYGSSLVPFINKFPRNTRLYKLMTTKPGEDGMRRK